MDSSLSGDCIDTASSSSQLLLNRLPHRLQDLLMQNRQPPVIVTNTRKYKHIVSGDTNFLLNNRGRCVVFRSAAERGGVMELYPDLSTAHYNLMSKKKDDT